MDTELGSDIGDRQPLGVTFGGAGDQGFGHFPSDAASRHASLIELPNDRGPVDAVPPSQRIDRCTIPIEPCKFIDLVRGEAALDRV